MASVTLFSGFDFTATPSWGAWSLIGASFPSSATFGNPTYQQTFYGTLAFDGSIFSGTVTDVYYEAAGLTFYHVSGASADMATLANYALAGQAWLAYSTILANNDQIDGSWNSDTILGYDGDDTVTGGGNFDTIDGGNGTDYAVFSGSLADYIITYYPGPQAFTISDQVIYRDETDTLTNVEYFVFYDQTVAAAAYGAPPPPPPGPPPPPPPPAGQVLVGADGDDTLTGGGGDDLLRGLAGNDTLIGNGGDDVLDGGTGADHMEGGEGADLYYVDNAGDVVVDVGSVVGMAGPVLALDIGGAIDSVLASVDYTLTRFVENLYLATGAGALSGAGNALANVLTGNEADNVFKGAGGDDRIEGLSGRDTALYDGLRANYTVARSDVQFIVQALSGDEGRDQLSGIERLQFADGWIALDMSASNNGGSTALLLGAVLGPQSLQDKGLVGAILSFFDAGRSLLDASSVLVDGGVMSALAGGSGTKAFVDLVVGNVIGAAPDAVLSGQLQSLIDGGQLNRAQFLTAAAMLPINQAHVDLVGLSMTGLAYVQ